MLDWNALKARANSDGEFLLHARFWNSTLKLRRGGDAWRLDVRGGKLDAIGSWSGAIAANLAIDAPEEDWDALLAPLPRPFYQDLYGATLHHGFEVAGDTRHYCAYYPALRRLLELMREVRHGD